MIRKRGRDPLKRKKKTSTALRVLLLAILLLALLTAAALYFLEPARLGAAAQAALKSALGVDVRIEKTRLDFYKGIGISFETVTIPGQPGLSTTVQVEEVFLGIELAPLLKRELVWRSIRFYRPVFSVERNPDGQWLLPFVSVKGQGKSSSAGGGAALGAAGVFVRGAIIQDGTVRFQDMARPEGPLKLTVRNLHIDAKNLAFGDNIQLVLSALVDQPRDTAQIALEARISLPEEMDLNKIQIHGRLKTRHLWGDLFFPYYARYVPMKHIGGRVTLDGTYRGNLAGIFRTISKVVIEHAAFDYPDAFEQRLTAPSLEVDTDVSLDGENLIIGPTVVRFPEGTVNARCSLFHVIGSEELRIDAAASTGTFQLEQVRKYIPTPIFPPAVRQIIHSIHGQGSARIVSGGTAGIVSNYTQMDTPEHSGMVWVHMALEGVKLMVPGMPKISGIRGDLHLKSGNLEASNIRLDALGGRWSINGKVNRVYSRPEISLDLEGGLDLAAANEFARSSSLPALDRVKKEIVDVQGRSRQKIKLSGLLSPAGPLEISGNVQLEEVSVKTHSLPHPITGASGAVSFNKKEFAWEGIKGLLGQSRFVSKGTLKNYMEKNPLIDAWVDIQVNAHDIAPFIKSGLSEELMLNGTLKATFQAGGSLDILHAAGKIVMDNAAIAFHPWVEKPVGISAALELEGSLSLQKELSIKRMELRIVDTVVAGNGRILLDRVPRVEIVLPSMSVVLSSLAPIIPTANRFQPSGQITGRLEYSDWVNGQRDFQFSGEMSLEKVSLQLPGITSPVTEINGRISMLGDTVGFHQVSALIGESDLLIDGTLQGHNFSRISLSFHSGQFNLHDFARPEEPGTKPAGASSKPQAFLKKLEGEAHISMNVFNFRQIELNDLAAHLKIHKGILNVQKGTFRLGKGSFSIDGAVDLTESHGQPFRFDMKAGDIDISSALDMLGGKGSYMTGRLNMDGSMQGIQGGPKPFAETLSGKISMDVREGLIRKYILLSKLFSLLNVSQLFGGRFPDLAVHGLPFHRITANGRLAEGVVHTDNFFLDGDAMKIVAAGQIDLAHKTIDAKIGVRPLLAVDFILNKIPLIGRILTGPNRGLIVLYYLVKGNLLEPEMTPIPVQSLGEGVVGIFGRLLNTPVDLLKRLDELLKGEQK